MKQVNLVWSTVQDGQKTPWAIFYVHILYLRRQAGVLVTPNISLPISTTTICELIKTLMFYDDIMCIAVKGSMIIYVDADSICQVKKIHFTQKYFEST